MADVVLSDVHIRLDRPERGERLAALVGGLDPDDRLFIAGDLCDFWFASRQRHADPRRCPGLSSLLQFRERGGELRVLLGNHDNGMGRHYERRFSLTIDAQPLRWTSHGLRIELTHGHLVAAKAPLESLDGKPCLPQEFRRVAGLRGAGLANLLDASNERTRAGSEQRMVEEYGGHAHVASRSRRSAPVWPRSSSGRPTRPSAPDRPGRLDHGSRYLRIDDHGVRHVDQPV